jgi:hypothetical protein
VLFFAQLPEFGRTSADTASIVTGVITTSGVGVEHREKLLQGVELHPLRPDDQAVALNELDALMKLRGTLSGLDAEGELVRITDNQTIHEGQRLMEDRLVWLFWFTPVECTGSGGSSTTECGSMVVVDGTSGEALIEVDSIG